MWNQVKTFSLLFWLSGVCSCDKKLEQNQIEIVNHKEKSNYFK